MATTNFIYDPERQGYDTNLWKTLVGTPTVAIVAFADVDSSDIDIDIASDSLTISENTSNSLSVLPALLSQAVTIAESATVAYTTFGAVNDAMTMSENVANYHYSPVSSTDSIGVTESIPSFELT